MNQCAPNSYWIIQENGAEQPKVYRHSRTMLKIRSTPTDGEQKAQMIEWSTEAENVSHTSYSLWEQKGHGREFPRTFFAKQLHTATSNIRSSRI